MRGGKRVDGAGFHAQSIPDEEPSARGMEASISASDFHEKCKAEMEKLAAELEKVAAEKDAAVAHQKELQDALDVANKQLKKEAIVIASKDEFIKTLIQTPAAVNHRGALQSSYLRRAVGVFCCRRASGQRH